MAASPKHHGAEGAPYAAGQPNPATQEAEELRATGTRPLYGDPPVPAEQSVGREGQPRAVHASAQRPLGGPLVPADAAGGGGGAPAGQGQPERMQEGGFKQDVGFHTPLERDRTSAAQARMQSSDLRTC